MPIVVVNRWSIPPLERGSLQAGTYKPGPSTTGLLPDVALTTVTGNVTLSVDGTIYENRDIFGRLSITGKNITVRNCRIRGGVTPNSSGLVACTNVNVENAVFEDCEIRPDFPSATWNGVVGHDFTLLRCNVYGCTDLVNVHNTHLAPATYQTGVVIQQSWLHSAVWWSAASPGVVHTSDTETHNDCIQHFGGQGTRVIGNYIDANPERQAGHYFLTNPLGPEPYVPVALGSLPDGGPYRVIADRLTGTAADGRYNGKRPSETDQGDFACILLNASQGRSYDLTVEDNWFEGGHYAINGGGSPRVGSVEIGSWKRNKFTRDQGEQFSGGNTTATLVFFGGWSGFASGIPLTGSDANVYEDDGSPVQVRL